MLHEVGYHYKNFPISELLILHLERFTPSRALEKTGISATLIEDLAFEYVSTERKIFITPYNYFYIEGLGKGYTQDL